MKNCEYCNKEHNSSYATGRFCQQKCARGFSTKAKRKEINKKVSKALRAIYDGPLTKKQMSKLHPLRIERMMTPCRHCSKPIEHPINSTPKYHGKCWLKLCGGYQENSTRKHQSIYKGFKMHSGSELEFAKLLDENEIEWIKNSKISFWYKDVEGKKRRYYPDFYLPKYDWWVEIKGRFYETESDVFKLEAVGNIELMYHDEIRLPSCL